MSDIITALALAARGIPVFPCHPETKRPLTTRGHLDASTDPATIRAFFSAPGRLIGVPTGARSGFDALDLDPRHGSDAWLAANAGALPLTRVHTTRSGGQHWLFKHAEGVRNSQSKIAPGLDVRGEGGFIIWWPDVYLDEDVAPWPPALLAAAVKRPPTRARPATITPLQDAVTQIESAQPGERYEVCKAAIWRLAALVKGGLLDEVEARQATIAAAEASGGEDMEKVERLWDGALEKVAPQSDGSEFSALPPEPNPEWRSMLMYGKPKKKGEEPPVKSNSSNASLAMRVAPEWVGVLGFDEFAQRVVLRRAAPWGDPAGEVRDVHITRAVEWLEGEGINVGFDTTKRAMASVAMAQGFDPLRDYYQSLRWDGVPRLATLFSDFFGAEDTELTRAFATRFGISLVARAMEPGCKVDTVPIFEGSQGIGKSAACRALVRPGWFTDNIPDLSSKDAPIQLQGMHLVEFAELDKLSRADMNVVKAFISTAVDRFRQPYGTVAEDFRRRSVFVGTVNRGGNGYLRDETGNRRFWPIACGVGWEPGRRIDVGALGATRDDLMAEAVALYNSGAKWWLDDAALESQQEAAAALRFDEDAWAEQVRVYLASKNETSTTDILTGCLRKPAERWTPADQVRVGKIMKVLGWPRKYVRVGGGHEYRYMRQDSVVPLREPSLKEMLG